MKLTKMTTAIAAATLVATTGALAADINVGGRVVIDYTDSSDDTETLDVTDARIDISASISDDWSISAGFSEGSDSVDDMTNLNATYSGFGDMANITIGQQEGVNGLDAASETTDSTFMTEDRSDYANGIVISGSNGAVNYAVGLFDTAGAELDWDMQARVSYAPTNEAGNVLHFGLNLQDNDDDSELLGYEAAMVSGATSVLVEYTETENGAAETEALDIQVAYDLNGNSRPYSGGAFGAMPAGSKTVALRYQEGEADDGLGGVGSVTESDSITLALNCQKTDNVRVSVEYQDGEVAGADFDSLNVRTQLTF